jgi:hypothetical protein
VKVGGARPPPFNIFTITHKVEVYAPAERADTLLIFLLYPYMYSVDMDKRTIIPEDDDQRPRRVEILDT